MSQKFILFHFRVLRIIHLLIIQDCLSKDRLVVRINSMKKRKRNILIK